MKLTSLSTELRSWKQWEKQLKLLFISSETYSFITEPDAIVPIKFTRNQHYFVIFLIPGRDEQGCVRISSSSLAPVTSKNKVLLLLYGSQITYYTLALFSAWNRSASSRFHFISYLIIKSTCFLQSKCCWSFILDHCQYILQGD